jgi:hypothetical protein
MKPATPVDHVATALRATLPRPVKGVIRAAIRGYGTSTSLVRQLPDFLILGAPKSGTTSLHAYLLCHPCVGGPARKEVDFFDRYFDRGVRWYRGHFPTSAQRAWIRARHGADPVAGEASPGYLAHPLAPRRVAAVVPEAKLIALLRNPIDRALSQYNHEVVHHRETLPFEEALERESEWVDAELARLEQDPSYFSEDWRNHAYLTRGRYAEQLERWLQVFPRDQLLIIAAEELFGDADAVYARVLEAIGAPPLSLPRYPALLSREYDAMKPGTRRFLRGYFRAHNERLYELIGRDLGWG